MLRRMAFCGPREAFIPISEFCKTNCIMCPRFSSLVKDKAKKPKKLFMDMESFKRIVKDLKDIWTQRVILIGYGEPLFHSQIFEMVEFINRCSMDAMLFTSGFPMTETMAEGFSKKKLDIILSLHGGDADTWLKIHPENKKEDFDNLKKVIKIIQEGKRSRVVNINNVITSLNYDSIETSVDFAIEMKIKSVTFKFVKAEKRGMEILRLSEEQAEAVKQNIQRAEQKAARHGILVRGEKPKNIKWSNIKHSFLMQEIYSSVPCYIGWYKTYLSGNGDVYSCCRTSVPFGNIKEKSIKEIWFGRQYNQFRLECSQMPNRKSPVTHCECYNCNMSGFNLDFHKFIKGRRILELIKRTKLFKF